MLSSSPRLLELDKLLFWQSTMQRPEYARLPDTLKTPRITLLVAALATVLAVGCPDPSVRKQHLESGNSYFKQANYPAAIIEFRNAIQIDARFGAARKQLGEAYLRVGDARGSARSICPSLGPASERP